MLQALRKMEHDLEHNGLGAPVVKLQGIKSALQRNIPVGKVQPLVTLLRSSVVTEFSKSRSLVKFWSLVYLKVIWFKDRLYVEQDSSPENSMWVQLDKNVIAD